MTPDESKIEILRRVEQNTLSIEEGAHLLEILERGSTQPEQAATTVVSAVAGGTDPEAVNVVAYPGTGASLEVPAGWRAVWGIFIWLGIVFMGLTGFWLYSSYARAGLGVGFWFALFFLMISCAIVYFGWQLLISRWVVFRIRSRGDDGDKNFSVWAPLPLHLARWIFHTFGGYMPESVQSRHIEEILQELEQNLQPNEPFVIDIDGEKGSKASVNIEF